MLLDNTDAGSRACADDISEESTHGIFYRDLSRSGDVYEACRKLFSMLREAEEVGKTLLLPDLRQVSVHSASEEKEIIQALWERLHRAAGGEIL